MTDQSITSDDFITVDEIVKFVHVSTETVRRWIRSGDLPHSGKVGKHYHISKHDLYSFLKRRGCSPAILEALASYENPLIPPNVKVKEMSQGQPIPIRSQKDEAEYLLSIAQAGLVTANKNMTEDATEALIQDILKWKQEHGDIDHRTLQVFLKSFVHDIRGIWS
jgi:excisionase family DNA binding protein